MVKEKISAVLNTYNASRHLKEVLESLREFDEIVVCDMESTDDTLLIASSYGCKIVTFPKGDVSICEPARDLAIHSAENEWVLVVDADELVPTALREYLYQRIARPDCPDGLYVPRVNKFLGEYVWHASPDYQLRFFRKDKTVWPPVIHCTPKIDGTVKKIPANIKDVHLLHLDDAPIAARIIKMNVYTDYELPKRRYKHYGALSMLWRPVWFFIRCYLLQGGILDGRRGITRSYMAAMYQMTQMVKIYESNIRKSDRI